MEADEDAEAVEDEASGDHAGKGDESFEKEQPTVAEEVVSPGRPARASTDGKGRAYAAAFDDEDDDDFIERKTARRRAAPANVSYVLDLTQSDESSPDEPDDEDDSDGVDESRDEDSYYDDEDDEEEESFGRNLIAPMNLRERGADGSVKAQQSKKSLVMKPELHKAQKDEYDEMLEAGLDELTDNTFRKHLRDFLIDVYRGRAARAYLYRQHKNPPKQAGLRASYIHCTPSKQAQTFSVRQLPNGHRLTGEVVHALESQGKNNLYSHQFEVLQKLFAPLSNASMTSQSSVTSSTAKTLLDTSVSSGRDVIITTPTSSGKSLCFNLGVFEKIIRAKHRGQSVTGLYLFPLNALAKDQEKKLLDFNQRLPPGRRLKVIIMTGTQKPLFLYQPYLT